jgi:hypothetical protein
MIHEAANNELAISATRMKTTQIFRDNPRASGSNSNEAVCLDEWLVAVALLAIEKSSS